MPKMKTKSSVKGRFSRTKGGKGTKIKCGQANKRHGMSKKSNRMIRNQRGTTTLCAADASIIKKIMPY